MNREDYGSHTEADAGAWAAAHAEPDENPMTLADVADDERVEQSAGHVCSGYCDPSNARTWGDLVDPVLVVREGVA